jgi:hypothetical protein
VTEVPSQAEIDAQIRELEDLAVELRSDELTPERVKELADRALELAERVSALAGGALAAGGSDTAVPGS